MSNLRDRMLRAGAAYRAMLRARSTYINEIRTMRHYFPDIPVTDNPEVPSYATRIGNEATDDEMDFGVFATRGDEVKFLIPISFDTNDGFKYAARSTYTKPRDKKVYGSDWIVEGEELERAHMLIRQKARADTLYKELKALPKEFDLLQSCENARMDCNGRRNFARTERFLSAVKLVIVDRTLTMIETAEGDILCVRIATPCNEHIPRVLATDECVVVHKEKKPMAARWLLPGEAGRLFTMHRALERTLRDANT